MKNCRICKISKSTEEFGKVKRSKDGLDCYCIDCRSEYYKNRKYNRKEYQSNYERKITEERKNYIIEYLKEYNKTYKRKKKYEQSKYKIRVKNILKRVLSYKNENKSKTTIELLGWNKEDFINKIGKISEFDHVDHKIPISWFIQETPVSIINSLENLQILHCKENLLKGNKYHSPVSDNFMKQAIPYIKPNYIEFFDL